MATAANQCLRRAARSDPRSYDQHCQGTSPPSRRLQTVLQGSSRGEEATKKLLAIGSALKGKLPSPQGMRRLLPADRGVKRACTQTSACEQQHRRRNTPRRSCSSWSAKGCCAALSGLSGARQRELAATASRPACITTSGSSHSTLAKRTQPAARCPPRVAGLVVLLPAEL